MRLPGSHPLRDRSGNRNGFFALAVLTLRRNSMYIRHILHFSQSQANDCLLPQKHPGKLLLFRAG